MSRRTMTIYGQMLLSEASLKRMTKAELIEYVLGLQDSYRISEECRELGAKEAEKLLNEKRETMIICDNQHCDHNQDGECLLSTIELTIHYPSYKNSHAVCKSHSYRNFEDRIKAMFERRADEEMVSR